MPVPTLSLEYLIHNNNHQKIRVLAIRNILDQFHVYQFYCGSREVKFSKPINFSLLVSKFMRNFTSIYVKLEFYFITSKQQLESEQKERKLKFWNFCSYLVFSVFSLVAINCVFFGQELYETE